MMTSQCGIMVVSKKKNSLKPYLLFCIRKLLGQYSFLVLHDFCELRCSKPFHNFSPCQLVCCYISYKIALLFFLVCSFFLTCIFECLSQSWFLNRVVFYCFSSPVDSLCYSVIICKKLVCASYRIYIIYIQILLQSYHPH